ncbi:MAG: hypothetical protein WDO69_11305 [Pseudomonadota bacterium]
MSISRDLLLLSCTPALVLACASRPDLVRSKPAASDVPRRSVESEPRVVEPRATEAPAINPYAPIRSRNAALYSWQSEKRAECAPESAAQLEPSAARGMLAAFPERTSNAANRAHAASPDLVVAGLRPALHHCFSRWLDARVDAQGSVRFALELGCAGAVEAISAENQGVDESTLACLFSAVAPARFAPPAGGHATVLVPVVFKNAAR